MRAMILQQPRQPLQPADLPKPTPGPGQLLIKVHTCGVCRTDLHLVDGELTEQKLPTYLFRDFKTEVVPGGTIVVPDIAEANQK